MASIQGPVRNQDILNFWNRHRFQIYKLCKNKLHPGIALQDLMQNVYLRLHTHFEEVRELQNPSGWLLRVAENLCNDELRRLARSQRVCESYFHYEVELSAKNDKQLFDEQQVNSMLNGISPNLGTLVDLHYLKGFSIFELSGISGISRSTIAKRLTTSVGKMRENVGKKMKMS